MTEQELLLRLERLEARGEIENLMARYQHYYTLRNSQAILVLEHGRIIERGDHQELLAQQGKYYQLYTGKAELS